jgi:SAM-dependent methyltransferase
MKTIIRRHRDFQDSFDFYDALKYKTNEYYIRGDNRTKFQTRMVHTINHENLSEKNIDLGNNFGVTIVKNETMKRFHPNNINNKEFWVRAHKSFPKLCVCGGECKNIKEVNKRNTQLTNDLKLLPFLLETIEKSHKPLKVLEIGFGYGNVFEQINGRCEYIGIDYVTPPSLKKHKNLIEINKSGIPDYLQDEQYFDIIYAVNVLQHCSQQDRFNYFEQGYKALKPGGLFIFSCNLMTEANKNEPYWGIKDKNGRGYLHFFNQLTEIDYEPELSLKLFSIGYKIVASFVVHNHLSAIIQKPK